MKKETIYSCIDKLVNDNYDSAFTGTYNHEFIWYKNKPLNYELNNIPRTQDLTNVIQETSGLYVFKKYIYGAST